MNLKDPSLFRTQAYIDGRWADADDGAVLTVRNPADGKDAQLGEKLEEFCSTLR